MLPAHFTEESKPSAAPLDGAWWRQLHDPVLDQLIATALAGSPDLDAARARVVQARAERAATASSEEPELSSDASYGRRHGSANVPPGTPPGGMGRNVNSDLWLAGFDASWEIDLFGGTRRAVESADASLAASVEDQRDAEVTLVAEVARDYVELRADQQRLAIARAVLDERRDIMHLTEVQLASGLASALDTSRAEAAVADSEAEVPDLEGTARAAIYRLGVLVGEDPEDLVTLLQAASPIPGASIDVPAGLPSDLLLRRPDIRAAEQRIQAANARIGLREADLYPHFALTGFAGLESLQAGDFISAGSRYFSVGPSLRWLVFDAGRVQDEMLFERARTDEAAAFYRKTVLGALGEVETALVTYGQQRIRRDATAHEVAASQQTLNLAERLYGRGLVDFLDVLAAEQSLHDAQVDQADADQDCALALISLYKSLGGGWYNTGGPKD